eukprot:CAMPEP_0116576886 /NCGR_PEP_ID=MMETSP0397-20121206/20806_1 /TAXON_ID=216820 /ORGANISM="Cyclophora tenuis, Strain ECT3854" /LENGTH=38 /DNA_ID= /DNA_START= /DNA_END= /DNA_ORIENTATION=
MTFDEDEDDEENSNDEESPPPPTYGDSLLDIQSSRSFG